MNYKRKLVVLILFNFIFLSCKEKKYDQDARINIYWEVKPYKSNSNGMIEKYKEFLVQQIDWGGADGWKFPIENRADWLNQPGVISCLDDSLECTIDKSYWYTWPADLQSTMLNHVFDQLGSVTAYKLKPQKEQIQGLKIDYLYNQDILENSNCWYVALDSILNMPQPSFIMKMEDFRFYLSHYFTQIDSHIENLVTGDLIRLVDNVGEEIHAAVVIGWTYLFAKKIILVGSKNGSTSSRFVIVDFNTLVNKIYTHTKYSFYRLKGGGL